MARPIPRVPSPLPMAARGTFEPSGDHKIEIDLGMSGVLPLTLEQVLRLERAFDAFKTEIIRIDGHTDLVNRITKTLGEF